MESPRQREFYVGAASQDDAHDDAFSISSVSLDDDDEDAINNNSIPKHKMTFEEVVAKYGLRYAEIRRDYLRHRRTLRAEPIGNYRDLIAEETRYFDFMYPRYPEEAVRRKPHKCLKPPLIWKIRFAGFKPPSRQQLQLIIQCQSFVAANCADAQRSNWLLVVARYEIGSVARFVWCFLFTKCTNGVSDKVSCPHFLILVQIVDAVEEYGLHLYKHPLLIAAILRQTSKWVKNTVRRVTFFPLHAILIVTIFNPFVVLSFYLQSAPLSTFLGTLWRS